MSFLLHNVTRFCLVLTLERVLVYLRAGVVQCGLSFEYQTQRDMWVDFLVQYPFYKPGLREAVWQWSVLARNTSQDNGHELNLSFLQICNYPIKQGHSASHSIKGTLLGGCSTYYKLYLQIRENWTHLKTSFTSLFSSWSFRIGSAPRTNWKNHLLGHINMYTN